MSPYARGVGTWKAPFGTVAVGILGWIVIAEVVWRLAAAAFGS